MPPCTRGQMLMRKRKDDIKYSFGVKVILDEYRVIRSNR